MTDSKNFGNSVLLEFYKVGKAKIAQSLEYETWKQMLCFHVHEIKFANVTQLLFKDVWKVTSYPMGNTECYLTILVL